MIGEEEVEVEAFEWMSHDIGGPSYGFDIEVEWCSHNFRAMLEVEGGIVVGFGNVGQH